MLTLLKTFFDIDKYRKTLFFCGIIFVQSDAEKSTDIQKRWTYK